MPHWRFVGQPGEFLTGRDGGGVPGRDLSQEDYDALAPDAQEALNYHLEHNQHPVYEYSEDDQPAPEVAVTPVEEQAPTEPPAEAPA